MTIKSIFIFGLTFLFLSCGQQSDRINPFQQELNKALAEPSIDDYYKEIYRQNKLITADDNIMLSITEKLFTDEADKDLFFFIVFTKSMNGSDGFYSEAVGRSAFKFITEKTEQFAHYFNDVPDLTKQDLDNWAAYVYGEIQISRESEEEQAVKELGTLLFNNTKEASKENKAMISSFMDKIKSMMP